MLQVNNCLVFLIADNIRYGANFREVTDEEVPEAAKVLMCMIL